MNLRIYYSSRAHHELLDRQNSLFYWMDTLGISYQTIDVHVEGLEYLKDHSPFGIQLPQIFDTDRFLGVFDDFEGARKAGRLDDFFYSNIQGSH
jgi:glutaredoxin